MHIAKRVDHQLYLFWFLIKVNILLLIVSHFSKDLSKVAASIDCFKAASYLSFRNVSILDKGGNGFLEYNIESVTNRSVSSSWHLQRCPSLFIEQCFDVLRVHSITVHGSPIDSRNIWHEKRQCFWKRPFLPRSSNKKGNCQCMHSSSATLYRLKQQSLNEALILLSYNDRFNR